MHNKLEVHAVGQAHSRRAAVYSDTWLDREPIGLFSTKAGQSLLARLIRRAAGSLDYNLDLDGLPATTMKEYVLRHSDNY